MSASEVVEQAHIDACEEVIALVDSALNEYSSRSLISSTEIMNVLLDIRVAIARSNN